MAYPRRATRRAGSGGYSRSGYSRARAPARRSPARARRAPARRAAGGGRGQTIRLVIESAAPSAVSRPGGRGYLEALNPALKDLGGPATTKKAKL